MAEYERQTANDDTICEVLAEFEGYDALEDVVAPESQHSVDSMETWNLWDEVLRDDSWARSAPIARQIGFDSTHPGGAMEKFVLVNVDIMPDRFFGTYVDWSSRRSGWAVLVPNRFLSESSFHRGDTPSWIQGDVTGEGIHLATRQKMVICDLGGYNTECHLTEENVRIADGPDICACGSEGGHGYGWWRRQHCFSPQ